MRTQGSGRVKKEVVLTSSIWYSHTREVQVLRKQDYILVLYTIEIWLVQKDNVNEEHHTFRNPLITSVTDESFSLSFDGQRQQPYYRKEVIVKLSTSGRMMQKTYPSFWIGRRQSYTLSQKHYFLLISIDLVPKIVLLFSYFNSLEDEMNNECLVPKSVWKKLTSSRCVIHQHFDSQY